MDATAEIHPCAACSLALSVYSANGINAKFKRNSSLPEPGELGSIIRLQSVALEPAYITRPTTLLRVGA